MTSEQAYVDGFVKRASEYGFNTQEALSLLKTAQPGAEAGANPPRTAKPVPGVFNKVQQYFKSKVPIYPTSLGNTAGGYDQLERQIQEQAGG